MYRQRITRVVNITYSTRAAPEIYQEPKQRVEESQYRSDHRRNAAAAPTITRSAAGTRVLDAPLVVVVGEAVLPLLFVPVAPDPVVPEAPDVTDPPVAVAPVAEALVVDAARKRSVDWNVWQFDDAGMRGEYGGGVFRGSGIDHVVTTIAHRQQPITDETITRKNGSPTPFVVYTPTTSCTSPSQLVNSPSCTALGML